jgi:hypothetical protein
LIFIGLTVAFLKQFGLGLSLTSPLLLSLAPAIILTGRAVGRRRGGHGLTAPIWLFITVTTVGYGEYSACPKTLQNFCSCDCLLRVSTERNRYRCGSASRNLAIAHNWPLISG